MKTIRFLTLFSLVLLWAVTAWGQTTLYGAPEVVRLPQPQTGGWVQMYPSTQPMPAYVRTSPAYGMATVPVPYAKLTLLMVIPAGINLSPSSRGL